MDTHQPANQTSISIPTISSSRMFGTKIPTSVAFIVAVLLFFMPFVDIRCNNMSLQQVSGIELATGFKMKNNNSGNSYLDNLKSDTIDRGITKATTQTDKKDPNIYALIALGLGILGLVLSFINAKAAIGGAMVTGLASAGALFGMMLDLKKKARLEMPDLNNQRGDNDFGNKMSNMADKMNINLDFTPWFYVAVVAFLAAAFFAYKRMSTMK